MPAGTTIAVRDLFYNTPARRKFLKSEQTELAHIAALVTHYALAHPERHFELHSATQALLIAPAVASTGDRLFQIFGRDTAALMLATAAEIDFAHAGLPEPPPWKREAGLCAARSRISAHLGVRLQAGVAEAQPQLDLRLRQPSPGARPGGAACAD
jgi:hypothetical protein